MLAFCVEDLEEVVEAACIGIFQHASTRIDGVVPPTRSCGLRMTGWFQQLGEEA